MIVYKFAENKRELVSLLKEKEKEKLGGESYEELINDLKPDIKYPICIDLDIFSYGERDKAFIDSVGKMRTLSKIRKEEFSWWEKRPCVNEIEGDHTP